MQAMWDHVVGTILSPAAEPDERVRLLLGLYDAWIAGTPDQRLSGMLQICKWGEAMQSDDSLPPLQYACVSHILRDASELIASLDGGRAGSNAVN